MASEFESKQELNLLELPSEILENIITYLPFHNVSESRAVCRTFNKHCQERLNKGFARVDKLHGQIQKEVKSKLPRRESERRNHPLARHVDILSAIETRISLLGMSYLKYTDAGMCCFIPGKVLDELVCILRTLQTEQKPPRSHEFLQELRDISSMAMEHFDEKIVPGLKSKLPAVTLPYPFPQELSNSMLMSYQSSPLRGPSVRSEITNINSQLRIQSNSSRLLKKDVMENKIGFTHHKKKLLDQEKKIIQQGQVISELEKKVNDLNQKFGDMAAEIVKLKEVNEARGSNSSLGCIKEEVEETDEEYRMKNEPELDEKTIVKVKDVDNSEAVGDGSSEKVKRLSRKRARDLARKSLNCGRKSFRAKKARQ